MGCGCHTKNNLTLGWGANYFSCLLQEYQVRICNVLYPFLNKISINFKYDSYCHNLKSTDVLIV